MGVILFLAGILVVAALCAWFISRMSYKNMVKKGNPDAKTSRNIIFVISFLLIAAAIFILIVTNIRLER